MDTLVKNITAIKQRIHDYEEKYDRVKDSVHLLAVSKNQPIEKIKQAYTAGLSCFGESYLQEALPKMAALSDMAIEWHFIGPIQSNKTQKIAEHFSWVHSVADIKIAKRLNDQRPLHLPPLNICIQVNTSLEASKSGIKPTSLYPMSTACLALPRLRLRGLMTIPAPKLDFVKQRQAFHQLFELKQTLGEHRILLDTLSMGMSDDFEAAIAEGSTLVRIGTALFGYRK